MADNPTDGSEKDRNAPTVRELRGPGAPSDTLPDVVGVYVPPRALPGPADHRTIDLKSVRLSDYVDARRALTERRLVSPARPKQRRSAFWLAPAVVIALGVGAWLFLRDAASQAGGEASQAEPAPAPVVTEVPHVLPTPSASPAVVVAPSVVPEPPPNTAPATRIDSKPSALPSTKAQRPREEKKRNNPWLE
jgi:hypothetical protein